VNCTPQGEKGVRKEVGGETARLKKVLGKKPYFQRATRTVTISLEEREEADEIGQKIPLRDEEGDTKGDREVGP